MRLTALLLSFILLLPSCVWAEGTHLRKNKLGQEQSFVTFPIKWNFTCSFPENLKADAREGFQYWDDLTKRQLFQEVPCGTLLTPSAGIIVGHSDKEYKSDKTEGHILGTAYSYLSNDVQTGGAIVYWKWWLSEKNGNVRRSVARHEVGHVLGFEHNERWESCLMYPYINTAEVNYGGHEKQACWSEYRAFVRHYR